MYAGKLNYKELTFIFCCSHKTSTRRRRSRNSGELVAAAGGKPLVEYSDVSSEDLGSGPELGEITEDERSGRRVSLGK